MAVRFPVQGNRYGGLNLPDDYDSLDAGGQKKARINAVSLQETPEDFVRAWAAFRSLYLMPLPAGAWYKHGWVNSPPAHYKMIHDLQAHRYCIYVAPRSFAKSTVLLEKIMLKALTQPYWETLLILAKDDFVERRFIDMQCMFEDNDLILQDFGRMRAMKGEGRPGLWNNHNLHFKNGAKITGMSIGGKMQGPRPHEIVLDDVEKDDSLIKVPGDLIEAFKNFFLNVVFPMTEDKVAIQIVGTNLSRRSFLHWLQTTDDPRIVNHWYRTMLAVEMEGQSIWKEKFSEGWIEERKSTMGAAAFSTQYMNVPSTEADKIFNLHPVLGTYLVQDIDAEYGRNPLASRSTLVSHRLAEKQADAREEAKVLKIERPFGVAVGNMMRFILVDTARTVKATSDRSAIHVLGIENTAQYKDVLWSLDLWSDRVNPDKLVHKIFEMARKWQVRLVGVESYGVQQQFLERVQNDLPTMFGPFEGVVPQVIPVKFPASWDKPSKIKGLEWRFNQYRLKIPGFDPAKQPGDPKETPYERLKYQIENFTEDLSLLPTDDEIDTLAMHQAIGKPRKYIEADVASDRYDPWEALRRGDTHFDTGMPVLGSVNLHNIPEDVLAIMLDRHHGRVMDEIEDRKKTFYVNA